MENDIETNAQEVNNDTQLNPEQKYLDEIRALKQNSVSKEAYEKLEAENKNLLHTIVEGKKYEEENIEPTEVIRKPEEIIKEMNSGIPATQYIKDAIEYRKSMLSRGLKDPFLPHTLGEGGVTADDNDLVEANKLQALLEHCAEFAGDDNQLAVNEFNRCLRDVNFRHIKH